MSSRPSGPSVSNPGWAGRGRLVTAPERPPAEPIPGRPGRARRCPARLRPGHSIRAEYAVRPAPFGMLAAGRDAIPGLGVTVAGSRRRRNPGIRPQTAGRLTNSTRRRWSRREGSPRGRSGRARAPGDAGGAAGGPGRRRAPRSSAPPSARPRSAPAPGSPPRRRRSRSSGIEVRAGHRHQLQVAARKHDETVGGAEGMMRLRSDQEPLVVEMSGGCVEVRNDHDEVVELPAHARSAVDGLVFLRRRHRRFLSRPSADSRPRAISRRVPCRRKRFPERLQAS
jgi:hypothetical protein